MSLAITAAPWTNDNNSNSNTTRRRIPNMRRTLKQSRAYSKDDSISTSNNNDAYSSVDVYDDGENLGDAPQPPRANIHNILSKISNFEAMEGEGLAEFNPPPPPELNQRKSDANAGAGAGAVEGFESTSIPSFDVPMYIPRSAPPSAPPVSKISAANDLGLYANYKQSYEPARGIGYFSGVAAASGAAPGLDKIMEKINYIIHMLEAQQHEKTNNVVEEVVLYTFLGVFIIFICDTFARAGKYHR